MLSVARQWKLEFFRLMRFGVIGIFSLLANLGLYAFLTRILWPHGPRTLQYVIVTILVTWLNYEANRWFTFQVAVRSRAAMGRFAVVAFLALGLNAGLFWLGHDVFGMWDFAVIVVNAFVVAVFTFVSHRLFTFHEHPWRWIRRGNS